MSSDQQPTNILLITSDQQHFDTLGFANPKISTPALDRLAREGTNFHRAYCPNPTCTPTRASIITGMYPSRHGAWTLGTKLPEDVPTVGDLLQRAGYATHLVGKAHFQPLASEPDQTSLECQPTLRDLDFWRGFTGPWYGFERIEVGRMHADESHVGQHYALWMEEKGLKDWRDYFQPLPGEKSSRKPSGGTDAGAGWNDNGQWQLPEQYHYTTWTGERTIANMEKAVAEGRPFFTWSSYHDPHPPYLVPEPWASMYDPADMPIGQLVDGEMDHMPPPHQQTLRADADFSEFKQTPYGNHGYHSHLHDDNDLRRAMAIYYGMISFMDHQIGQTLDALDRLGVAENTLVIFTTDHGHFLGQHGLTAKGAFHYEDVLRLPFLVRWPGRVATGQTSNAIQSLVDLAPTFCDAAGVDIPLDMQGVNQLPVWTGQSELARDHAIVENRHQPTAIHLRTYINDRYKLTIYRDRPWGELFDLHDDPDELRNRFDDPDYATIRASLFEQLANAQLQREPLMQRRIASA